MINSIIHNYQDLFMMLRTYKQTILQEKEDLVLAHLMELYYIMKNDSHIE